MKITAKKSFAIAMPTLARTAEEARQLRSAIEALSRLKAPLIIADAASHPALRSFLSLSGNVTLIDIKRSPGSSLASQIKASLDGAATLGLERILYTEPDKRWFFENRLETFLDFGLAQGKDGMVIASRDESSFQTFPPIQRLTERLTNELLAEFLQIKADFLYGPLLIAARFAPLVRNIPDDLGWGWRTYLMAAMHRLGCNLTCFTSDLSCPVEQRGENDEKSKLYRMEQMAQNIRGLVLGRRAELSINERSPQRGDLPPFMWAKMPNVP